MVAGSISKKVQERDRRVYEWLCSRVQADGRFPTVREIMTAIHLSSPCMAQSTLNRLEEQGLVLRQGKHRILAGFSAGVPIPVLGTIAAGVPLMAEQVAEGYVHIRPELAKGKELFALRVRGDSMINAGILENDTVILEKTSVVADGEIAAVWLEDAATVKRIYREQGGLRLVPENPAYEPIQTKDCTILGRVVALVRDYE